MCVTLLAQAAFAQIPAADSRNTVTPNTDTHFVLPTYTSLEAWNARRSVLRQQILSAAGLSPMPPKTPLHPEVFGRLERNGYSIEKVLLETMPHYYLGGNLYRPVEGRKASRRADHTRPLGLWTSGESAAQFDPHRRRQSGAAGLRGVRHRHGWLQRHAANAARVWWSARRPVEFQPARSATLELDASARFPVVARRRRFDPHRCHGSIRRRDADVSAFGH